MKNILEKERKKERNRGKKREKVDRYDNKIEKVHTSILNMF